MKSLSKNINPTRFANYFKKEFFENRKSLLLRSVIMVAILTSIAIFIGLCENDDYSRRNRALKEKPIMTHETYTSYNNEFYDYDAKYILDSKVTIPAIIDEEIIKEVRELSEKIFKILSLKDLSRIDFLYDVENKKLYFNEVNTLPGFTTISMYPMLINAAGINIKELITTFLK